MSIISQCFQSDEHFALELLKTKASSYDEIQPLELAEQANCRVFLSSKAVQRSLDHQWSFILLLRDICRLLVRFSRFGRINSKRRAIHLRVISRKKTTEYDLLDLPLFIVPTVCRVSALCRRRETRHSIDLEK